MEGALFVKPTVLLSYKMAQLVISYLSDFFFHLPMFEAKCESFTVPSFLLCTWKTRERDGAAGFKEQRSMN